MIVRIGVIELDETIEASLVIGCAFGDAEHFVWRGPRRFRPFVDDVAGRGLCVGPLLFTGLVYSGISPLQAMAQRRGRKGGPCAM